jgi:hypothetical protein
MSCFAGAANSFEKEEEAHVSVDGLLFNRAGVSASRGGANLLAELTGRFRSLETRVQAWMAKQPTHIETTVTTTFRAM